jgi:hypothetical protein
MTPREVMESKGFMVGDTIKGTLPPRWTPQVTIYARITGVGQSAVIVRYRDDTARWRHTVHYGDEVFWEPEPEDWVWTLAGLGEKHYRLLKDRQAALV